MVFDMAAGVTKVNTPIRAIRARAMKLPLCLLEVVIGAVLCDEDGAAFAPAVSLLSIFIPLSFLVFAIALQ